MLDNIFSGPAIKGLYVDGRWQATPGQFDDLNPSDGTVWAQVPDAGAAETRRAIEAAHRAFPAWSSLRFQERAHFMLKIADIWDKRAQDYVLSLIHI